ncbi:secreted RxLR effector peptide protein, putative [Phytophthora infestans T30-4]|uniref:Secreted RxLR effector peptide protein, putative n=1 Tax=Phytophthora infestans (strain T30-4) TaxID=403677 RepID=D0N0J8_PHYIT|nr:secreted RxLR effector peptide protein, putative [Phytophthora infestans T30-4]EEY67161.1 secreted RxLR effector peptide protein, putative [Phytophthora infestans T30-4]|eukprot:XP_002905809.1 secreted RxLR effector peptide protein, putative [Phytophthora infestans T30-4]
MRSIFYAVLAIAVVARSSTVAAFLIPDESRLFSKPLPNIVPKRYLRVAGQEVVQSRREDGNGGIWKSLAQ